MTTLPTSLSALVADATQHNLAWAALGELQLAEEIFIGRTPQSLAALDWSEAQPLVTILVRHYPPGPVTFWGWRLLLLCLCHSELPNVDDATPSQFVEWLCEGARRKARSLPGYAVGRLSDWRRGNLRALTRPHTPPDSPSDPEETLRLITALRSLSELDRLLLWSEGIYPEELLARDLGFAREGLRTAVKRAKAKLQKALLVL